MRLYELLLAAPGTIYDHVTFGAFTELAKRLQQAQCFVMSEDVCVACSEVSQSRPSTILAALDMIRAPYPFTWIEWQPSLRHYNRDNHKRVPKHVGCLLETDPTGTFGSAVYAWSHDDGLGVEIDPIGLVFDWNSQHKESVLRRIPGLDPEMLAERDRMWEAKLHDFSGVSRWARLQGNQAELDAYKRLCRHSDIFPVHYCMPMVVNLGIKPGSPMFESYMDDIAGELPYVESFLLLLNSRNRVVTQQREDLSKLNKARAKHKKPPFKEFIVTKLAMSRAQGNKARALGLSREAARLHMVRGHFKVRKSGVFWWSSFPRGGVAGPSVTRREYVA